MTSEANFDRDEDLARALATIEEQKRQITQLKDRIEEDRKAQVIHDTAILMATSRTIASPIAHTLLLNMIVKTAATVMHAQAASLFLLDEEKQELTFEVALGPRASEAKRHRVPLGHGIAGFVALSAQPIAITDAENSSLHASDIAQSIGYIPYSILGVPLFYNEQVIGVLELLDKEGNEPFDNNDMELGSAFANQAAVAIELSRTHGYLTILFRDLLQTTEASSRSHRDLILEYTRSFIEKLEDGAALKNALELATLVQQLVWYGEEEQQICREILQTFARHQQNKR